MPSIFAPPRNKPKISIQQPTMAAGQPFVPPQVIGVPVNLVGDDGTVYGRMGENPNGPELVSIKPPPGPTNDPAGGPEYASGGNLLIGGNSNQQVAGSNPYTSTIGTGIFSGNWNPPTIRPPTGMQNYDLSLSANPSNPNATLLAIQQQQIAARNNALNSRQNVLNATGAVNAAQQRQNPLSRQVNQAQQQQNQMQGQYYQQQGMNQAQTLGEQQAIYAASQNAPDLLNVADAQNLYNAENRRAGQFGVAPPAEVNLPPGYNGPREAGVRPKIMTQEERLAEKQGYEKPIRDIMLSQLGTQVSIAGIGVNSLKLLADEVDMDVNEAQQALQNARLAEDYAQLDVSRADLKEATEKLEPFPGAVRYTNPETGEGQWTTPWKKSLLEKEAQQRLANQGLATKYSDSPYYGAFSVSELESMLAAGNGSATLDGVIAELIKRGLTPQQAEAIALDAYQRSLNRSQGGSSTLPLPGQQTTPSVPVTPATQPAAAPSGRNPAVPNNLNPGAR